MRLRFFIKIIVTTMLFAVGICFADNSYTITTRKILYFGRNLGNSMIQLHEDSKGDISVILQNYVNREMNLFTCRQDNWETTSKIFDTYTNSFLFEKQKQSFLCTSEIQVVSGKKTGSIISFYRIGEEQESLDLPDRRCSVDYNDKIFGGNNIEVSAILPLPDPQRQYLLLGSCTERKLDPLNILGTILSGGHSGFDVKPFVAEMNNDQVVSYFLWPQNLASNEVISISYPYVFGDQCHVVGTCIKEYQSYIMKIEYASLNFQTKEWVKPEVIYRETRKGSDSSFVLGGGPEILATKTEIIAAWSLLRDDLLGPGVFARSKMNNIWGAAEKLSDSGDHPLLRKSSNGTPYIFWHEAGKGLFFSSRHTQVWKSSQLIIDDPTLSKYGLVWDVHIDKKDNIHLAFLKPVSKENDKINQDYEVVYIFLLKN